jgi:hypothetical protein
MNKYFVIILCILVTLGLVGLLTSLDSGLTAQAEIILGVAEKVALIMMLANGTFYSTRYFTITKFLIGIVIIGALMKILHLPNADVILLTPFAAMAVVYTIHFSRKRPKTYLDVMKLLTVIVTLFPGPLKILHLISYDTKLILDAISLVVQQRQNALFR